MKFVKAIRRTAVLGFGLLLILLWVNEVYDLPAYLLNSHATPFNPAEAMVESIAVLLVLLLFLRISDHLERRIKYLEGLTVICSECRKVKTQDTWTEFETWLAQESEVEVSHGLCATCLKKLYPEEYEQLHRKGIV